MADSVWQNLSSRERLKYEKQVREKNKNIRDADFTRTKNPQRRKAKKNNEDVRDEKKIRKRQSKMTQELERTVRSLDRQSSLRTYRFHTAHANYFCKIANGTYMPCEIALAEFSLVDGITRTYHTLINPGAVPLGYSFYADVHAAETHRLPLPPSNFGGESNQLKILANIKLFLMGDDKDESNLPPVYSLAPDIDAVDSILSKLNTALHPAKKDVFRVLPLSNLFYELSNASIGIVTADLPTGFPAECELQNDIFEFTAGISCHFHEKTDARKYCSLSRVQRWSFVIMKHCCRNLAIDMIPGRHYPLSKDLVNKEKTVTTCSSNNCQNTFAFDHDRRFPGDLSGQLVSPKKCGQTVKGKGETKEKPTPEKNKQLQIHSKAQTPQHCALKPLRRPKTTSVALLLMSPPNVHHSGAANSTDLGPVKEL